VLFVGGLHLELDDDLATAPVESRPLDVGCVHQATDRILRERFSVELGRVTAVAGARYHRGVGTCRTGRLLGLTSQPERSSRWGGSKAVRLLEGTFDRASCP
jgi:hypothetical protein